jgi:uncharacterized protein (TIGR03086 family)
VTDLVDLEPATRRMAELIAGVPEGGLAGPTPCPAYTLGDLLDHVGGLTVAFTTAANKGFEEGTSPPPSGDAARLGGDWRARIPRDLVLLAEAWRSPEAWTGRTEVGASQLPGELAGVVALDELVVHGWDLARSTGQPYECDRASLEVVHGFLVQLTAPEQQQMRSRIFGPVVDVPSDATLLARIIGLTGRDPAWSP